MKGAQLTFGFCQNRSTQLYTPLPYRFFKSTSSIMNYSTTPFQAKPIYPCSGCRQNPPVVNPTQVHICNQCDVALRGIQCVAGGDFGDAKEYVKKFQIFDENDAERQSTLRARIFRFMDEEFEVAKLLASGLWLANTEVCGDHYITEESKDLVDKIDPKSYLHFRVTPLVRPHPA